MWPAFAGRARSVLGCRVSSSVQGLRFYLLCVGHTTIPFARQALRWRPLGQAIGGVGPHRRAVAHELKALRKDINANLCPLYESAATLDTFGVAMAEMDEDGDGKVDFEAAMG